MPVLCRSCATSTGVPLPAMRVSRDSCQSCGGYDDEQRRNYSVESIQIPGSSHDPNRQAEVESKQ